MVTTSTVTLYPPNAINRGLVLLCVGLLLTMPRPVHGLPSTHTATQAANGLLGMGRLELDPKIVYAATSTSGRAFDTTREPYLGFGRRDADLLTEILTVRVPELVNGVQDSARIIRTLGIELELARKSRDLALAETREVNKKLAVERTTNEQLTKALEETQEAATMSTGVSIGILVTSAAIAFAVGFLVAK